MNVASPDKKYCIWRISVWGPLEKLADPPESLADIKRCMYTIAVYKRRGVYELWCHRDCPEMYMFSGDQFLDYFATEKESLAAAKATWKKACKGELKAHPQVLSQIISYDLLPCDMFEDY